MFAEQGGRSTNPKHEAHKRISHAGHCERVGMMNAHILTLARLLRGAPADSVDVANLPPAWRELTQAVINATGVRMDAFEAALLNHPDADSIRAEVLAVDPDTERVSDEGSEGSEARSVYAGQSKTLADAFAPRLRLPSVVSNILNSRSLSIWYGLPGSLKSNLLFDLCLAVTTGSKWLPGLPNDEQVLGFDVAKSPVLWVDVDNGEDVVAERLAAFARAYNVTSSTVAAVPFHWLSFPIPPLVAAKSLSLLAKHALSVSAGLIVIDNLLRVSGVRDENSSEIDTAMANLRKLAEDTGAATCVIHHRRKETFGRAGDSLRGHSSIEAAIDVGFLVDRDGDVLTVKCTKARRKPVETFAALWTFEHGADGETLELARFYRTALRDEKAEAEAALFVSIKDKLQQSEKGCMTQTEIAKTVGGRKEKVIKALTTLVERNEIAKTEGKRGSVVYSLP